MFRQASPDQGPEALTGIALQDLQGLQVICRYPAS
jgi:hypothetical protein